MLRTYDCGRLRPVHAGVAVEIAGWVHRRRDHGGLVFVDLRDATGIVQVVFHPEDAPEAFAVASDLRAEYVVRVEGEVVERKPGTENADLDSGRVEVAARAAEVLNEAETPPFPVNQDSGVDEATRLRYRYLDLRRERMAANLRMRHRVVRHIRRYLDAREFLEIETPVLGLATPEGARDYLVPSRVHPGRFYALPQSPQQWKQLLVVAGFERYYQIARCYRDEDLRADRQPEFTQLDLEMAFAEQDDVLDLIEGLYADLAFEVGRGRFETPTPFPRMSWRESMERYGSDKPDLRTGLEIRDLSAIALGSGFGVFREAIEAGGRVRGFAVPGGADLPRRGADALTEMARELGAGGLVWIAFGGEGPLDAIPPARLHEEARSPAARHLDGETLLRLGAACGASRGDMLLIVAAPDEVSSPVLDGLMRRVAADRGLADPGVLAFALITDFPMFERAADGGWSAVHHLFTSPYEEDDRFLETDPGQVRSRAYDLVCNGQEIGSGSIRIHRRERLLRVLDVLGLGEAEAEARFGHMLRAFTYGAPPHGGIALGIDRTAALLAGERDIREVIAFPKTKTASDPLTGAPSAVEPRQLADVHVALTAEASAALASEPDPAEDGPAAG